MPFNLPATLVPFYALFNPRLLLPSLTVVRVIHSWLYSINTLTIFLCAARYPLPQLCCITRCRLPRRNIRQRQLPSWYFFPLLAQMRLSRPLHRRRLDSPTF